MPSPPGWPVRLKTGLHPFRDEASISAQCGHQNRKQSASKAGRIIQRQIQYFSISKQLNFPAVERNIPQQVLQIENRMEKITMAAAAMDCNLRQRKLKVGCLTFVKSVGHHATEVTSSLWPCSIMGGCVGSEICEIKLDLNSKNTIP